MNGTGVVRVADYANEFATYEDFPSGTHLINPMTNLIAHLARPDSSGVRKELGLTTFDGKGAVLRVGRGKYRRYPENYWKDSTTLYINYTGGTLPNLATLKKCNPMVTFVERPTKTEDKPKYRYPEHGMWSAEDHAHALAAFEAPFRKEQYKIPVPNPVERVATIPPPPSAITHYGNDAKIMAPLAEIIHRDTTTLIVKTDGKVLVCRIETEV